VGASVRPPMARQQVTGSRSIVLWFNTSETQLEQRRVKLIIAPKNLYARKSSDRHNFFMIILSHCLHMSEKFIKFLILFFVLTVIFFAFLPSLTNGFVPTWDDSDNLTNNVYIRSLNVKNMEAMFSTTAFKSYISIPYIPLTLLSYSLEYKFFGYNPFIYHLDNLLLHLGIVLLIFLFIQKMGLSFGAAIWASLLFGIHPMHVESVAWVTERKDVLYAFFYLLALCCYADYLKTLNRHSYLLTVLCGLLSILSKPMALSLPLILFICDWWFRRPWSARVFLEKVPIMLYMAGISWITYTKYMKPIQTGWIERFLVWIWNFIFYIEKFVFPSVLLAHYELPLPVLFRHPAYLEAFFFCAMLVYSILRLYRNRLFLFAWLFYFISIFFLIRFENVILAGNLSNAADRFMYLPSLGFCILCGVYVDRLMVYCGQQLVWKKISYVACVFFIFVVLAAKTFFQCKIWKSDVSLWSYQVHNAPADPLGYINRALGYKENHQYPLALTDDSTAIMINPHYYVPSRNPKDACAKRIADINLALANNPFLVVAYRNRGFIYKAMGKNDLALKDFKKVLEINPIDDEVTKAMRSLSPNGR
jgi:protein O-mannosyl-transferase